MVNNPSVLNQNTDIAKGSENITLQIKQEQLDMAKQWIKTGEVKIYREILMGQKNFTVPTKREELVIENKSVDKFDLEQEDAPIGVIRILLSEERVEFTKHMVDLEDVSIYKQQIEYIKHIENKLKRESPKIKIYGSPKVRDD